MSRYVDYERVAALYRDGRSLPAEVLDRWGEAVAPYLPTGSLRVVDVGAGTGVFAAVWPRWAHATVVAVEPAAEMVRFAGPADPGMSFVRGIAEALPLRDASADLIWVSTALHHFADLDQAISECVRVLRRGGRVLVRTFVPGRTDVAYAAEFPGRSKWMSRFHDFDQLHDLFEAQGFTFLDVQEVLEWTEPFGASAEWVSRMRHADSMLTALSDDDIAEGLARLRARPNQIGRLELTLLVFERP